MIDVSLLQTEKKDSLQDMWSSLVFLFSFRKLSLANVLIILRALNSPKFFYPNWKKSRVKISFDDCAHIEMLLAGKKYEKRLETRKHHD